MENIHNKEASPIDFIGNAPIGFLDQSDAVHPAGFPIMTNKQKHGKYDDRNIVSPEQIPVNYRQKHSGREKQDGGNMNVYGGNHK